MQIPRFLEKPLMLGTVERKKRKRGQQAAKLMDSVTVTMGALLKRVRDGSSWRKFRNGIRLKTMAYSVFPDIMVSQFNSVFNVKNNLINNITGKNIPKIKFLIVRAF